MYNITIRRLDATMYIVYEELNSNQRWALVVCRLSAFLSISLSLSLLIFARCVCVCKFCGKRWRRKQIFDTKHLHLCLFYQLNQKIYIRLNCNKRKYGAMFVHSLEHAKWWVRAQNFT